MWNKGLVIIILVVLGGAVTVFLALKLGSDGPARPAANAPATKVFTDKALGVSLSVPKSYIQRKTSGADSPATNTINFERSNPQAFLTFKRESGLAAAASLQKKSLLEYIEGEIRQFFPVRYSDYRQLSLERRNVDGRPAVDLVYQHTDQDGNRLQAHLVAAPDGNDAAHYVILQATPANFAAADKDLVIALDSLKFE